MGIGTLNEHSLHAFLKDYYGHDKANQEIKIGRYVADIVIDGAITEIQTRNFRSMKNKLKIFLQTGDVTVVYPIARKKRLIWVDPDTGEMSKPRMSPKTGTPFEIFYELVFIKDMLQSKNLHFKIILLDMTEYRLLNGWNSDRKKGSVRMDRVPGMIIDEIAVNDAGDYLKLLPDGLPEYFTVKELMKYSRVGERLARRAIYILSELSLISRCGKRGRAFLYKISK